MTAVHDVKSGKIVRMALASCLMSSFGAVGACLASPAIDQAYAVAPKISKKILSMDKGDSSFLKLKNAPASKVKWSSNKPSVVSVSKKGTLKAKGVGKAVVFAKYGGKNYKCNVVVRNAHLNGEIVEIHPTQTYSLKLIDGSAKSWKSSDTSVAKVNSSGIVTAQKPGTATIVCTAGNSKKYSCVVNVASHVYSEVLTAPTCTEGGFTTYTCSCGYSYVGSRVKATGHHYAEVVTAPTCLADGFTTHICSCGKSYVDQRVRATGHTPVVDAAVAATFTSTGLTEGSHCSKCGEVLVPQVVTPKSNIEKVDSSDILIGFECTKEETSSANFPYCGFKIVDYGCTADKSYAYVDHDNFTPEEVKIPFTLRVKVTCTSAGRYIEPHYSIVNSAGNTVDSGRITHQLDNGNVVGKSLWVKQTVHLPAVAGFYTIKISA